MQAKEDGAGEKEREFKSENMVWTRIYYGREVMERILDTIDVKRALHQRFFLRYTLRAGMAGIIICLMYIFVYQIKTDLGHEFNSGLGKYLTGLSFSMALVFIYFTNSELLTSNFMYFTVGRYYDKVTSGDTMKIWGLCLIGNMLGIVFIRRRADYRFNGALKLAINDGDAFVKDIQSGQPEPPLYFATMKRVNRDGIAVTGSVPKPPRLNAAEFSRAARDKAVRILDARDDRKVFDAAHVAGAIHAPLRSAFFSATAGSYLAENDSILLVLEKAEDADLAVRQLYRIGFDHVLGWITAEEAKAAGLSAQREERIDFPDFQPAEALQQGEIIDVRTTVEFQRGHLDGALSFPYTRLKTRLGELPKNRRLFIHCGTGKRASLAASFLRSAGFDAVHIDGVCAECERIASAEGVAH
jgi:rhodanese-related sulfurtransferase